ncbi:TonB-dependent receptor [Roseibacterium sp. SDUM158017]|uniref:TonB-dependent receptor plug domain-containing protein n=1 Tax=Roseicyclus salinarum TaxID=3036773 RepID=UPI002415465E|nr:TonB-dependent receptor [Roseibacterium sp. SDUM158017]MDG4647008.1 TonB-dependent receptor [Roseibacterium sp. SDUM158017]
MNRILSGAAVAALFAGTAAAQDAFVLDDIVFSVNAANIERSRVGNAVSVVTAEDLEQAGDLQLADYLASLPGVSLTRAGPPGTVADLRIRGAQGRYISVYVDGILVTDPSGTSISYDDFGGLSTGSIRRIEVLRGSQSALYGGTAVGGVINISTLPDEDAPEGTTQSFALEAGSNETYSLSYGLVQRTGAMTLSLGLDHTQSEGFSAADENDGNTEADGFDRSRASFGAEYEVNAALTIGVNGFVETGATEFDDFLFPDPVDGTPDDEQERVAHGARAYLEYTAGDWTHDAALSLYEIERRSRSDGSLSVFRGERLAAEYTATARLSQELQLSFGLRAQRETAIYDNIPGGEGDVETTGAFLEALWSPSADIDVTATVRRDEHSAFGGDTNGRLAFAWRPTQALQVRGAVGTGYRPPSIDELYGDYPDPFFPFVGNPDLTPEESFSAEVGFDYRFSNGAELGATAFLLEIENLVTFEPGTPSTLVNAPGVSTRRGLELSGRFPINEMITLHGAYTFTDAQDAIGDPLSFVPEHDLVVGLDAEWGSGFLGMLTARRVTGTFEGGTPLPDYTVVDTSVAYEFRDGMEAYFRIHNLLDEQYQVRRGYGTSDRAFQVGLRASF